MSSAKRDRLIIGSLVSASEVYGTMRLQIRDVYDQIVSVELKNGSEAAHIIANFAEPPKPLLREEPYPYDLMH